MGSAKVQPSMMQRCGLVDVYSCPLWMLVSRALPSLLDPVYTHSVASHALLHSRQCRLLSQSLCLMSISAGQCNYLMISMTKVYSMAEPWIAHGIKLPRAPGRCAAAAPRCWAPGSGRPAATQPTCMKPHAAVDMSLSPWNVPGTGRMI
jgi:hypothetical protein